MKLPCIRVTISFLSVFLQTRLMAQQQEQLWLDYQLDYPFKNVYLLEGELSYQTLLSKEDKWRSLNITPTFEYAVFTQLDLIATLPVSYTVQKPDLNTIEIGPMIGGRFYLSQGRRFDIRFLLRLQQRVYYQVEADDIDVSNRIRPKIESWISLNGPNMFADNLWYLILDYEEFIVTDQQLDERYAYHRRARLGLGYRLNYKNRFDLFYARQTSRNEINDDFTRSDNLIQLRYKMYLNPPSQAAQPDEN